MLEMEELRALALQTRELADQMLTRCALHSDAKPVAPPAPAEWMTVKRFAQHRQVCASTIRKWIRLGMPHSRSGRVVRVRLRAADEWVDGDGPRLAVKRLAARAAGDR
jgi:hypothetical protein